MKRFVFAYFSQFFKQINNKTVNWSIFGHTNTNQIERMTNMTFKKTSVVASLMLSTALLVGACGDKDEITKDVTKNDTSNDIEDSAPGENPDDVSKFEFSKFELEVNYPDQEEAIDVNYEEKQDATDAEYRNVTENLDETGETAFENLRAPLETLQLKEDMTDEEILSRVVKAFNIEDNYTLIEADITWANGEEKKVTAKK